ncbi:MAG: DinB family protein, partial [Acidobacteria bacterium]|nr:DinB family protein [Acidobacteriota bacterium]
MKLLKGAIMLVCMICICISCTTISTAAEPTMTAEERAKTIKWLKDSQQETLDALEKLSDEQLKFKPAPDRWSVIEVAEHILLAEGLLFARVQAALA